MPTKATALEENARLKAEHAKLLASFRAEQASWERQRELLTQELQATHERALAAERERDALRRSYERLKEELELLRRRLVVAKAERVDTQQLELEFAVKLRELEEMADTLGLDGGSSEPQGDGEGDKGGRKPRPKPTGRRDLSALSLPVEEIVLTDPTSEAMVAAGDATLHGYEESHRVMYQRGGHRLVKIRRAKYRRQDEETGETRIRTARRPKELLDGTIFAPSFAADLIYKKVSLGLPFYRQERELSHLGLPLDRGTMSRMAVRAGDLLGDTVVRAMRADAMANAFCIATDATGLKVQPVREPGSKKRVPCHRGHVLVLLADRDHVLFEYLERETSASIAAVFEGYQGPYIQADAKAVYDVLYRARPGPEPDPDPPPKESGCWSHLRRKFWEATVSERAEVAREGLYRIGRIFAIDAELGAAAKSPEERKRLRERHLRPHVAAFFTWSDEAKDDVPERTWLAAAFGYAERQRDALERFFEDGRLRLDNNRAERALRKIAIGRKNWLFAGSNGHAEKLAHLFSLEASARLHGLDPAAYFRDLIRVLPHWPRDRFLELCPRDWAKTRDRLDPRQLAVELGDLTVPSRLG